MGKEKVRTMPQTSLLKYVEALDRAGLLTRFKDEKRVDELPKLMEDNPDTAIFVEKVKDCSFPYLANAYGARSMWALALGCDMKKVGVEMAERSGTSAEGRAREYRAVQRCDPQG
jgi:2,5-furandicarboxylate decarboxylase 1